jgi:hypothetical protein
MVAHRQGVGEMVVHGVVAAPFLGTGCRWADSRHEGCPDQCQGDDDGYKRVSHIRFRKLTVIVLIKRIAKELSS